MFPENSTPNKLTSGSTNKYAISEIIDLAFDSKLRLLASIFELLSRLTNRWYDSASLKLEDSLTSVAWAIYLGVGNDAFARFIWLGH